MALHQFFLLLQDQRNVALVLPRQALVVLRLLFLEREAVKPIIRLIPVRVVLFPIAPFRNKRLLMTFRLLGGILDGRPVSKMTADIVIEVSHEETLTGGRHTRVATLPLLFAGGVQHA